MTDNPDNFEVLVEFCLLNPRMLMRKQKYYLDYAISTIKYVWATTN